MVGPVVHCCPGQFSACAEALISSRKNSDMPLAMVGALGINLLSLAEVDDSSGICAVMRSPSRAGPLPQLKCIPRVGASLLANRPVRSPPMLWQDALLAPPP